MRETMKRVSHQQARQLLHNKFIVVLGDSIQRSVYKDLVMLLQKEQYLSLRQLKTKGEMSFEQDCLVEGGCLNQMSNGTEYREVRQFQTAHHLVRFYFVTRIYSRYMQSILDDFRRGLKPDVVIVNSCVWDISRYQSNWTNNYRDNLCKFFEELRDVLPTETLTIWNVTMPLGERIRGGFLVPEIEHKAPQMRHDVIEANFYSATLANAYGMDVLDLHFQFRFSLQHRTKDGVHWNALAHRKITSLLLEHSAQAWGVVMSCPLTVEHAEVSDQQPAKSATQGICPRPEGYYNGYNEDFFSDSLPSGYMTFENNPQPQPQPSRHKAAGAQRRQGFYRPPHHFEPYNDHRHFVMRNRHSRHHYAPYAHYRPSQYYASHDRHYY